MRGLGRRSGHVRVSRFTAFNSESSPGNHPCTQVQGSLSFLRLFLSHLGDCSALAQALLITLGMSHLFPMRLTRYPSTVY